MNRWLLCIVLVIALIFVPYSVKAYSFSDIKKNIYVLEDTTISSNGYNQESACSGDDSLLGDPTDKESVAWLLQKLFDFTKVIGPILVVLLSSFDFARVIIKSDDDSMAKAQKKLWIRLVLAALLFFVPTIVDVLLGYLGFYSTCGIS